MKMMHRFIPFLVFISLFILSLPVSDLFASDKVYICPPCDERCHAAQAEEFSEPGSCPICSMTLVDKETVIDAAIFIFDGVQIIDYTAPYEIFGQARFNVFTVAEKKDAITTVMGMSVNPKYSFDNHPEPDILLVPGGRVRRHQDKPEVQKWLQENAERSDYVLSVCNGAFFLAKAGLLDGLSATTNYRMLELLEDISPNTEVLSSKRFVDNGKIITSAGLSAGMDASLHVVSKINGMGRAQSIALNLEYNWQPDVEFARGDFPDYKYLRHLNLLSDYDTELIYTKGSTEKWEQRWSVKTETIPGDLLREMDAALEPDADWMRVSSEYKKTPAWSEWKLNGENSEIWRSVFIVMPREGVENELVVKVAIERIDASKTSAK